MSIWSAAITLFLVLDPIGNIPAYLAVLKDVPDDRRRWVILRENVIALVVLLLFFFVGEALLQLLHVNEPALSVAGGVVIFLIALKMIFPRPGGVFGGDELGGEPFIVPLAIPLLAGPSAMATVVLLSESDSANVLSILGAWLVSVCILMLAPTLSRWLGKRGLIAAERLMGMLLIVIAVQMMLGGIENFVAGLET